jgi:hypothetical protein
MASCDSCGAVILFGGHRQGNWRFCNEECARLASAQIDADRIPREAVEQHAQAIQRGDCPQCGGPGPVDVYSFHRIWSALAFSRFTSHQMLGCWSCGRKAQVKAILFSTILGWWSVPYGFIFTPIQIIRNFAGLLRGSDPDIPSPALERVARLAIASEQGRQPADEARRVV